MMPVFPVRRRFKSLSLSLFRQLLSLTRPKDKITGRRNANRDTAQRCKAAANAEKRLSRYAPSPKRLDFHPIFTSVRGDVAPFDLPPLRLRLVPEMETDRRSVAWIRTGCVVVTAAALYLVFRHLRVKLLVTAFEQMRPAWFACAVLVYGLLFVPASWRWHLVLRVTGKAVTPMTTARVSLIGHFFYVVLFGAVGGDAAKATLYSRWFHLPLPEVLATAPLDRFLGFCGLVVFALAAAGAAAASGTFSRMGRISFTWPGGWILLVLVVAIVAVVLISRARPGSIVRQFLRALAHTAKALFAQPRVALAGTFCGLLVQVALSSALGFNLQAVTNSAIPWHHLFWTFPVISLVSGMPLTVAGLGAREGVALVLLSLYGIPEADAVAASLLTLAASLVWAIVGAFLLWQGVTRRKSGAGTVPKAAGVSG